MANNILIIVPCYRRPEMLFHCLEYLKKCTAIERCRINVVEDSHIGDDIEYNDNHLMLIMAGLPHTNGKTMKPAAGFGNTRITLESMRDALDTDPKPDLVILLEEDVMVAPDFILWHEAIHDLAGPFASVAARHPNPTSYQNRHAVMELKDDPRGFIVSQHYASLGAAFRTPSLRLMSEHALPSCYEHSGEYMDERFPSSRYRGGNYGQAGLINRIIEQHYMDVVYPTRPRAYHAGWYGLNRGNKDAPQGTLAQKIDEVGRRLNDHDFLVSHFPDCEPCSLEVIPWTKDELACLQ